MFGLARRADADVPAGTRVLVGDLLDHESLRAAVAEARPDELYHLAAPTYVPDSYEDPDRTRREIVDATEVLLEAAPDRVFVASSAEIFGEAESSPQNEESPKRPRNPYGEAKLAAFEAVAAGALARRPCGRGDPLQPRVHAAPGAVRAAARVGGGGEDQARPCGRADAGGPRGRSGLVGGDRLDARGDPGAAPRRARRLRDLQRRRADGARAARGGVRARRHRPGRARQRRSRSSPVGSRRCRSWATRRRRAVFWGGTRRSASNS